MTLDDITHLAPNHNGSRKSLCPRCSHTRKNKHDHPLSVTREGTRLLWNCHNCGWKGVHDERPERSRRSVGSETGSQRQDTERSRMRDRMGDRW